MENELSVSNKLDFDTLQRQSLALYKSGYFKSVGNVAQAIVKVMAGAELGFAPFASMTGISVINGMPSVGANLIATLVDSSPDYDYKDITPDGERDKRCDIEFFKNKESRGIMSFTIEDAQRARLLAKDNWKCYPSAMLFNRALSAGVKRFIPGVASGVTVYADEELEDEESKIIDANINNEE